MSEQKLAEALRSAALKLRRTPMPLSDLIPLLNKAADALAAHEAEQEQAGEAVACWTLKETLDARQTTCRGRLWFSDPKSSAWTALYTRPQQPLSERQIEACMQEAYATVHGRNLEHAFARATEAAHGIGTTKEPTNAR